VDPSFLAVVEPFLVTSGPLQVEEEFHTVGEAFLVEPFLVVVPLLVVVPFLAEVACLAEVVLHIVEVACLVALGEEAS